MAGTNQKEVKLKEYRYTGKERDEATGLYYYGARYYASWVGRWLSADPLFRENTGAYEREKPKVKDEEERKRQNDGFKRKLYSEGLNLYVYVSGNPIKLTDPYGREEKSFLTHSSTRKGLWAVGDWMHEWFGSGSSYIKKDSPKIHSTNGDKLRDEIINSYKTHTWKNITWHTATMDGKTLSFAADITKGDISNTKPETFELINDMLSENSYSACTISSLYRPGNDDSHGQGLGVDLTEVMKDGQIFNLQDLNPDAQKAKPESAEAKKILNWLLNESGGRVNHVLTPWSNNGDAWKTDWRDAGANPTHIQHNNHYHFRIILNPGNS